MATSRTNHEDKKGKAVAGFRLTNRNGRKPRRVVVKPRGPRKVYTRRDGTVRHVEGYGPRPKRTDLLIPKPPRRARLRCAGVAASGKHPRIECGREVLWTYRVGRPVVRCGECRVIAAWRMAFTKENPIRVAAVMVKLAEAGVIGAVSGVRNRR